MKKLMAGLLTAALLVSNMPVVYAASDAESKLSEALKNQETSVSFKAEDPDQTFLNVFESDPALYYFFGGYEGAQTKTGKNTLTITYQNTDVSIDDVFVANDSDDLYNIIGLALAQARTTLNLVVTDSVLTKNDIVQDIDKWKDDNYLVYMGFNGANASYSNAEISAWTSYTITLDYMADSETVSSWREQTDQKLTSLASTLFALDMPDYQKELLIHDYLVQNCTYEETSTDSSAYTAYGALVTGRAVCEGYAEAAELLFKAAGLECQYVEGSGTSSDHVWNCVKIDGQYYWIDVTWDDPVTTSDSEDGEDSDSSSDSISHSYFNLTDGQLAVDHAWQTAEYPSCTSTTWSYSAVSSALSEEQTNEDGTAVTYSDYSSRNVTPLATVIDDLAYAVGADTSTTATGSTAAITTDTATADSTDAADNTDAADSSSGSTLTTVLKVLGIIVLAVILLGVAAIVFLRIQSRIRYNRRREERRRAERRSGRSNAARPASARPTGHSTGRGSASRGGNSRDRRGSGSSGSGHASSGRASSARKSSGKSRSSERYSNRDNPFRS